MTGPHFLWLLLLGGENSLGILTRADSLWSSSIPWVCKPEMQWSRKCVGAGTLAHFQDRAKEVTIMLVAAGQ
jgi:hypothetical protein